MKQADTKRLARFLLSDCKQTHQVIDLSEDLMHYASRVLRIRDQEQLRIWNGHGQEFLGRLDYLSKKEAQVTILEGPTPLSDNELTQPVFVLQALPEGDKMDWILEKSTELGAQAFFPVQAQRSVVKLQGERIIKRHTHWERVVQSACLQAERGHLPVVHRIDSLEQTLGNIRKAYPLAQVLWFTPSASETLSTWVKRSKDLDCDTPLVICVGPEGGWSPEETELAAKLEAVVLSFSNRVLRTETFALACISQLTAYLGLEVKSTMPEL